MKKELIKIIRVYDNGTAEKLEGKFLENYLKQEGAAFGLLISHSWAQTEGEIKWVPCNCLED